MIVINFKNYLMGEEAVLRAKLILKHLPKSAVAVSALDLKEIAKIKGIQAYAQHVDYVEGSRGTGYITPKSAKKAGAVGTLLNHSEHRIPLEKLKKILTAAKWEGLRTIVFASSLNEVRQIAHLEPDAIAYEVASLVASEKSIITHRTDEIIQFARMLKSTGITALCGAGISSAEDYVAAREFGSAGVVIGSAIASNDKPVDVLKALESVKASW